VPYKKGKKLRYLSLVDLNRIDCFAEEYYRQNFEQPSIRLVSLELKIPYHQVYNARYRGKTLRRQLERQQNKEMEAWIKELGPEWEPLEI
jgi:hypothetical protein